MRYSKWDEVVLKVDDAFGYKDKVFARLKVMVLGIDTDCAGNHAQYLCYVPPYERVPYGFATFTIDRHHIRHFNLEAKFLGDMGCFITSKNPIYKHIVAPKGEKCDKCKTFFEGVNREDDGTYFCRSCKENPWR